MTVRNPLNAIDLFVAPGPCRRAFGKLAFAFWRGKIMMRRGATFAATHPEATFVGGPIQDVTADQLLAAAGVGKGEIDVIVSGPTCQGYSVYIPRA